MVSDRILLDPPDVDWKVNNNINFHSLDISNNYIDEIA